MFNLRTALTLLLISTLILTRANSQVLRDKTVTHEEAEAFGRQIELAMTSANINIFLEVFDKEQFINIMGRELSSTKRDYLTSLITNFDFQKLAAKSLENFGVGNYRLLRAYEKSGRQHLLFRLFGDAGINYHDFLVDKIRDSLKVTDVFVYTLGENMSEYFLNAAKNIWATTPSDRDSSCGSNDLEAYNKSVKEKDYPSIIRLLETSKSSLLQSRSIQLYHIQASKKLGDSAYFASLERFTRLYPDAPNVFLYQIDAYFGSKQYDKALAAVERLAVATGGDPYLDYFRGNLNYAWGKTKEAIMAYERLFVADPLMNANTRMLIKMSKEAGDSARAYQVIKQYELLPAHDQKFLDSLFVDNPELKK